MGERKRDHEKAQETARTILLCPNEDDLINLARCYLDAQEENASLRAALPDDLRAKGWAVAAHNDYRLNGEAHTFWLFTKGDRCVKGESKTDAEALSQIRSLLAAPTTGEGD